MHAATEDTPETSRRTLALGAACWFAGALVLVAARGVRWDENYEFAQVVIGSVPYPEGHPLHLHAHNLFSLQTHALAGWMMLGPDAVWVNGARNALALIAAVLPVFLLAAGLTGRARWGHAAALLTLAGIHAAFYSNYPVQIWPDLYSNGQVGQGWALTCVALLVCGQLRTAYFLAGMMPAIHLGQFPPVAILFGLHALSICREGGALRLRIPAIALSAGLCMTLLYGFLYLTLRVAPPAEGVYASSVPADAVYRAAMERFGGHRDFPWTTGQLTLAALLLLTLGGGRRQLPRWLGVYAAALAALVWGIGAVHLVLGLETPRLLLAWMPYRLLNHAGPLLIAAACAVLAGRAAGRVLVAGALAYVLARPVLAMAVPAGVFERYLADGSAVLLALAGAAIACAVHGQTITVIGSGAKQSGFRHYLKYAWKGIFEVGLAGVVLIPNYPFAFACGAAGAAALGGIQAARLRDAREVWRAVPAVLMLAAFALLLAEQARGRAHLPGRDWPHSIEAGAMVVASPYQEGLQARLNRPMMTDMAAITWIPYEPELGPALDTIYREVYGMPIVSAESNGSWVTAWAARPRAEWERLAADFGFRYVLAPEGMTLDLDAAGSIPAGRLYRVGAP